MCSALTMFCDSALVMEAQCTPQQNVLQHHPANSRQTIMNSSSHPIAHTTKANSLFISNKPDIPNKKVSMTAVGLFAQPQEKERDGEERGKKKYPRSMNKELVNKSEIMRTWKLSQFVGGRHLGLDPVFSHNEKHLLVAHALSLKIFSSETSLLVRIIMLPAFASIIYSSEYIVSFFLDRSDDRVYVATSNSRLYLFDFERGKRIHEWNLGLGLVQHVCLCPDQILESSESEVVYVVSAGAHSQDTSITRVSLAASRLGTKVILYRSKRLITAVQIADAGRVVCFISEADIVVIHGECRPRAYKMPDLLTCMDIYLPSSSVGMGKKSKQEATQRYGDIVVGDCTGAIYLLHGVIKCSEVETDFASTKYHWHRVAVCSVKWALDGSYIVSGGLETVLVIWQLATGHKQFLPHMGAGINNIVVSPRGSAYVLNLSNNSILTLSTSELIPTANIAGIQSAARPRESHATPCLLHPYIANTLLIASSSNQLNQSASSPFIQAFDTYSDRHISRQALTRTNATIINHGPDKYSLSEPDVVFIATTNDGQWLASIDEWQPFKGHALSEETAVNIDSRKKWEVYLKFWKWSELKREWEFVTRIDSPHPCPEDMSAGSVLDLIAAPNGHAFLTLGIDGCVKIWKPKGMAILSVSTAESTVNWGYRKSVNIWKQRYDAFTFPQVLPVAFHQIQPMQWWGNVAFSEDGSLLAVSCPDPGLSSEEDSLLQLIDPDSGSNRQSVCGLHIGRTSGLAILGRYLIVAGSQKLMVWNIVHGRVEWEYSISELTTTPSPTLYLAVDWKDQTFAIAFSVFSKKRIGAKIYVWGLVSDPNPVFTQDLEAPVAALKSAGEGQGFIVLDRHSRVQYVTPLLAAHASVVSIITSGQQVEDEHDAQGLLGLHLVNTSGDREMIDVGVEAAEGEMEKVVFGEVLQVVLDEMEICEQGSIEVFQKVLGMFAKPSLQNEDIEVDKARTEIFSSDFPFRDT
ncbi:quinon protein alcohol dehydrogenase-like superfamily [Trichophaea hybrida]|nr:quinon protein alcohol dehydrogenase-like superfamily [Trichophaea hybrida]